MTAKWIIVCGAAVVTAGAVFIAAGEARSAAAAESAKATLESQRAAWDKAGAAAQVRLANAAVRRQQLEAALQSRPSATAAAARAAPAPGTAAAIDRKTAAAMDAYARMPWRDIALEQNPELQARYLESRRAGWRAQYDALGAGRGLTETQVEKLLDTMAAGAARQIDLKATLRAQGISESDAVAAKLLADSEAQTLAAQRELLGEDGYRRWQEHERVQPLRVFVDHLATSLVFLDAPLSGEQSAGLLRILAEANDGYRRNGRANGTNDDLGAAMAERRAARDMIDYAVVLAEARTILSPQQHAFLESSIGRTRIVNQMFNLMRESSSDPMIGFTWGRR